MMPLMPPLRWIGLLAALLPLLSVDSSHAQATLELEARLTGLQTISLHLPVGGRVEQVLVSPGQTVTTKTLLLTLDPRPFAIELARAKAAAQSWQPVRDEAQREQDRAQALYAQTLLSEHELQLKQQEFQRAVANYQQAQAELEQAQLNWEYSKLYPPFPGIINQRLIEPGQMVVNHCQAMPLLTLANPQQMLVEAWTNQTPAFTIGQAVIVDIERQRYPSKIHKIEFNTSTQRYMVHTAFTPQQIPVWAGQAAKLRIESATTPHP